MAGANQPVTGREDGVVLWILWVLWYCGTVVVHDVQAAVPSPSHPDLARHAPVTVFATTNFKVRAFKCGTASRSIPYLRYCMLCMYGVLYRDWNHEGKKRCDLCSPECPNMLVAD